MDFDSALAAHQEWKVKLRGAISGKSQLDAATIAKDDCCELGKWLRGEAKPKLGALPVYRECVETHAAFHREAGKVAVLINAGKYAEAESALGVGTPYSLASSKIATAIVQMRRKTAA